MRNEMPAGEILLTLKFVSAICYMRWQFIFSKMESLRKLFLLFSTSFVSYSLVILFTYCTYSSS